MNTIWTHEEAKNSFDSLIEGALAHHAQIIELKNQQKVREVAITKIPIIYYNLL